MPHHSCSLLLGIVDFQPQEGRHHVAVTQERGNRPLNSLSISKPFLAVHPHLKLYTYEDILREDPNARRRREERERLFSGWDQFVHLAFWDGDKPDAVLSVRRTAEQGNFSQTEREFLNFLHPTLDAGLRRLRKLHRERERGVAMESYLRGLPISVAFVEADGHVAFATPHACELCAIWNYGVKVGRSLKAHQSFKLPREIVNALEHISAHSHALDSDRIPSTQAGLRLAHPDIPELFAKIDPAQTIKGPWGRPGFWVTFAMNRGVAGMDANLRPEATALLQLLSPSERQVALSVTRGLRNQEIARQLSKSLRTVEFQLNMIYRKVGLTNRTQLMRALL